MKRFVTVSISAAVLMASGAYFGKSTASAQSTAACPTGFSLAPAGSGDITDVNTDGLVCQSEPDIRPSGIVETLVVDNTVPECGCPPGAFVLQLAAAAPRADRNEDGFVCMKTVIVGPPGDTTVKQIFIDNRKCNP